MLALFTDFGFNGPYLGQMKAALLQHAPAVPVVDLFADAPAFSPVLSSHLLAAYSSGFPPNAVFLCVVDPGVGSQERSPVIVRAGDHCYVGPHNGLFDVILARCPSAKIWKIDWQPASLSASFHGRDLFAPIAATLANGQFPQEVEAIDNHVAPSLAADLPEIIYIDNYGNLITGLRAAQYDSTAELVYKGQRIRRVSTFSDVEPGSPLCYSNSAGMLEIALNQGSACRHFAASLGDRIHLS